MRNFEVGEKVRVVRGDRKGRIAEVVAVLKHNKHLLAYQVEFPDGYVREYMLNSLQPVSILGEPAMRHPEHEELKKEIMDYFFDSDNPYEYSDRLQVALHETLDNWVSTISSKEVHRHLELFSDSDIETLDKGLYEGVLEKRGYDMFNRVLLYCLIEQDLYNEEEFNKLQFKEKVAGIKLK